MENPTTPLLPGVSESIHYCKSICRTTKNHKMFKFSSYIRKLFQ
jgi:hypothetical protein